MYTSKFWALCTLALASLGLAGCISTGITLGDADGNVGELSLSELQTPVEHHLSPEDQIQVVVWDVPEFKATNVIQNTANRAYNAGLNFVVHDDGTVDLPLVGNLHVEGMTVNEARDLIVEKLRRFIVDPQVGVTVSQYTSRKILVLGEVGHPGIVAQPGSKLSVAEALAQAGGTLAMSADTANVYIIRGAVAPNAQTVPEDKIVVFDDNGVPHDFKHPNANQLRGAASTSKPRVTRVPLDTAVAMAQAQNMWLQSRDVVFVNSQLITDWNRFMIQLMPSITDYFVFQKLGVVK